MVTSTLPTPARTVKVRIAVAVAPDGKWNSCGWGNDSMTPSEQKRRNQEIMELAIDVCGEGEGEGEARYWLEVELPVPTVIVPTFTPTVEGA